MSNTDLNLDKLLNQARTTANFGAGDHCRKLLLEIAEMFDTRRASPQPVAVDEQVPSDGLSPVYGWLQRAARSGIAEVEDSAYIMMAYYQGAEFPEPESAAPSAQIADDHAGDERAKFEVHAKAHGLDLGGEYHDRNPSSWYYWSDDTASAWEKWLAERATQPPSVPVQEQSDKVDERALFEQTMREQSSGEPDWKSATAFWAWFAWQRRAALAQQSCPPDSVPVPQTVEQAVLMQALGLSWLQQNAPERLTELGRAMSCPPVQAGAPMLLNADELAALRRFNECALDGECYDVPKEMMQRLAEIGVVRRKSGAYYEHTEYGLFVLDSTAHPAQDGEDAQKGESNV